MLGFMQSGPRRTNDVLAAQMREWCHKEGWRLAEVYAETSNNGAFESLLRAIKKHEVRGVLFPSYRHLGPRMLDRIVTLTADYGVGTYSLSGEKSPAP